MTTIRIVLADDHPVVVAGVKALLQAEPDMELVGEASMGEQALQLIGLMLPDIAVIDISMPDLNGIDLAKSASLAFPNVKLLVLTVHEDHAYVQRLLQAGVRGYLLKRTAAEELVRAIRAVAKNGLYLDPAVASKAVPGTNTFDIAQGNLPGLSPREVDTLRLTARGFSNKEIATQLEISTKSVETYKSRAVEKLSLRTRADIVRFGIGHGWLDSPS